MKALRQLAAALLDRLGLCPSRAHSLQVRRARGRPLGDGFSLEELEMRSTAEARREHSSSVPPIFSQHTSCRFRLPSGRLHS